MTACVALTSLLTISTRSTPLAPQPPATTLTQVTPVKSLKSGFASWYGAVWEGRKTASGEIFEKNNFTAAHKTLPFGTMLRVTDTHSGKSVVVRVNDRGTLTPDRVIDLSSGAAEKLGILQSGIAKVKLEILKKVSGKSSAYNPV